ncbi:MAG: hypothetical protein ACREJC_04835, partial [Tepidisphaeraceae bacterium]
MPIQTRGDGFLDVAMLLETSQPRGRSGWLIYALGAFILLVLTSSILAGRSSEMAHLVNFLSSLAMVGVIAVMAVITLTAVRAQREEIQRLEAIEELIQLRRWPAATMMVQGMLLQPLRTPGSRTQALIFLSSVLSRYGRFDDAIMVQEHLLNHVRLDPGTQHALRLGRAMAMLRQDHLFDADRAINELRRDVRQAAQPEAPDSPPVQSAGLALIEMYRDVKTGHPQEAIDTFVRALPALRVQLGHRVSDAYALLARANDLLARDKEAREAWENATLLAPISELARRYPELSVLNGKYQP